MGDEPRRYVCQPCRIGQHVDHRTGIWMRMDGSDPVICTCSDCVPEASIE